MDVTGFGRAHELLLLGQDIPEVPNVTPDPEQLDIYQLILESSGVVAGVLIVLVLMSLVSWYIIGYKLIQLRRAQRESDSFLDTFWNSKDLNKIHKRSMELGHASLGQVYAAGYVELAKLKKQTSSSEAEPASGKRLNNIENVERALRRAVASETTHLERLVPFLASVGSTAPFIGLFGTVWGILKAFLALDTAAAAQGISFVAVPIAEALIATAIGLVAAIPSVMAFNYFIQRIKVLTTEMDNFAIDFLNIAKRQFFD